MMPALVLLHRWLGVAFCLVFAMWFASGIVMHFVPYPATTEPERFAGLAPLDVAGLAHGPADAVAAGRIRNATRVRLLQRSDGPVYLVAAGSTAKALRATDLADAAVASRQLALAIATDHARRRQLAVSNAQVVALAPYDQWTLSAAYNAHRPLYRIALNDSSDTELYVSSTTGEVVLTTARRERQWNYLGSVAHWIYPTTLRSHPTAWSKLLWWLSLLALIGAAAGAVLGVMRIEIKGWRPRSPYRGWQAWHHGLGLICMLFVLTWMFSGWLSMDDGRLFSTGKPTDAEIAAVTGSAAWHEVPRDELQRVSAAAREVEWFAFGGRIYRRDRITADQQRLFVADAANAEDVRGREFLGADEIDAAAGHLAPACNPPVLVGAGGDYVSDPAVPNAPVFRLACGSTWFHLDAASGLLLEKLDPSRRVYRWLYRALHTLDFPALTARPALREILIIALCGCGLAFSLTGVAIAGRRLLRSFGFSSDGDDGRHRGEAPSD